MLVDNFRMNVIGLLKAKGMLRVDLAKLLGNDRSYITAVLNRKGYVPTLTVVEQFAKALRIDPLDLLAKHPKDYWLNRDFKN